MELNSCVRSARKIFGPPDPIIVDSFAKVYLPANSRIVDHTLSTLSRTDFSSFHKVFRLRNYLFGRANSLERYFIGSLNRDERFREVLDQECYNLRALANQLDINSVVSHAQGDLYDQNKDFGRLPFTYERVFRLSSVYPKRFSDHCIFLFGSYIRKEKVNYKPSPFGAYLKRLSDNSRYGRKAELLARLDLEFKERKGWYCVFNSLTVRPGSLSKVFSSGSSAWHDYIQKADRLFGISANGSWRSALRARSDGQEFHSYFAVVERGSLFGRLHIHVLHFIRVLPPNFADPNLGLAVPNRRQVECLRSLWQHGFSAPVAVRFSPGDAYGLKGWLWPAAINAGVISPLKVSSPGAMVSYIGKYLTKAYSLEASTWRRQSGKMWRARLSRNLGSSPIKEVVSKMSRLEVQSLLLSRSLPKVLSLRIPRRLLRLSLVRKFLMTLTRLAQVKLLHFLRALVDPRSIRERFLVLIGVIRPPNLRRCGSFGIPILNVMVAFDRAFFLLKSRCYSSIFNLPVGGPTFAFAR